MFNSAGMHVVDVQSGHRKLVITVETDAEQTGCRVCGVVAIGHGRRRIQGADGSGVAPSRTVLPRRGLSSTS